MTNQARSRRSWAPIMIDPVYPGQAQFALSIGTLVAALAGVLLIAVPYAEAGVQLLRERRNVAGG